METPLLPEESIGFMKTGYPIFSVQESAVVCSEKDLKIGTLNLFFFKNFNLDCLI